MREGGAGTADGGQSRAREWVVAGLIALAVVIVLQVPYWLGYAVAAPDTMYTGLLVNVEDANYITIIQRGSEGAWLHSLRFTSEPDAPAFLYVFYLAWGHVARLGGLDATTMWHLARAVMGFVTFMTVFGFVGLFLQNSFQRWVAWLLAILGAGFDWAAFPWETLDPTSGTPADLKMADAHLFHAALTFPHYLGSITCLLIVFWCAVRVLNGSLTRGKLIWFLVVGALANVGVALVYPFFVILSCGVLTVYGSILMVRAKKILWDKGLLLGAMILPVVPIVAYYANALATSEQLRVWSAQSQTLSPNPLHYFLTFAPYLVLGGLAYWHEGLGDGSRVLLWAWVIVVAILVYAPLGAQRRFLQGVQVPLAILATVGLFEVVLPRLKQAQWFQNLAKRPNYSAEGLERLVVVLVVLMISMSSAYQWLSAIALTTVIQPYPIFRPRGEVEAMDWLRGRASADDIVLSAYFTGSYLPYRSGMRAYLGHVYETIHFQDKQRSVNHFFDVNTGDAEREGLLAENQIGYLFYGRAERESGGFDPARASYLRSEFANEDATIFRVVVP